MSSWTCDGVVKDGKPHPEQHSPGPHEPQENFGDDCVFCGLKREAISGGGSTGLPIKPIAIGVAALSVLGLGGLVVPKLLTPTTKADCPLGQQLINGSCQAVTTPSPSPTSTTTSASIPGPIVQNFKALTEVTVPAMNVKYGGSTSFAPLRNQKILDQIQQAHPNFKLVYTEPPSGDKPGSGSGIRMLLDGQISFAQSSRSLNDKEFKRAQDRGFNLDETPVAIDGLAIYVNPKLSVSSLTKSQVRDVFTGQITNWKDVGGPDLAINPMSRNPEDGGTPEFFIENVLEKKQFAPNVKPFTRDTTESIRKVSSTIGGVGYATASEVCNQSTVKTLSIGDKGKASVAPCNGSQVNLPAFVQAEYPITRRLFVIIRKDGKLDEQAGVAYANLLLSDEGQMIIEQAGLAPIRNR